MIIKLRGWCIDRELQVLCRMLEEANLHLVRGKFTLEGFETETNDISIEVQTAIADYFAPGSPVARISPEEQFKILQDTVDQLVLTSLGV